MMEGEDLISAQVCVLCCSNQSLRLSCRGNQVGCFKDENDGKFSFLEKGDPFNPNENKLLAPEEENSLCPPCKLLMTGMISCKVELEETERDVRRRQRELLMELRKLKGQVERFKRQFLQMSQVVEQSRKPARGLVREKERNGELIRFREKLLTVVGDLQMFYQEIFNEKINYAGHLEVDVGVKTEVDMNFVNFLDGDNWIVTPEPKMKNEPLEENEDDVNPFEHLDISVEMSDEDDAGDDADFSPTSSPCASDSDVNFSPATATSDSGCLKLPKLHGMKPKQCDICGRQFKRADRMRIHRMTHMNEEEKAAAKRNNATEKSTMKPKKVHVPVLATHPCLECDKIFKSKRSLRKHSLVHKDPSAWKFECATCKDRFRIKETLDRHVARLHKSGPLFGCQICEKKFSNENYLRYHVNVTHGERSHKCSECEKTFKCIKSMRRHKLTHKGKGPAVWKFQCSICAKRFCSKRSLDKHGRTHEQEGKPFICQFCNGQFPCNQDLATHVRKEHIDKGDVGNCTIYQCEKCSQKFLSENRLKAHMKQVHVEKSHQCSECGMAFKISAALAAHTLIHKGPEAWKFQCSTCGYLSYSKANLELHMVTHECICKYCNKQFPGYNRLSVHMRREHNGDKAYLDESKLYQCSQCNSKFLMECYLKSHMRDVHSGLSFNCAECGKSFKTKANLKRHPCKVN